MSTPLSARSPHLGEQLRLDYLAAELFADFAAQAVQRRFTGLWLAARQVVHRRRSCVFAHEHQRRSVRTAAAIKRNSATKASSQPPGWTRACRP
jgi:hypothetical protein